MTLTQITEKGIKDGEIINADINASAAIAGTKISPDFGTQIVQTGNNFQIDVRGKGFVMPDWIINNSSSGNRLEFDGGSTSGTKVVLDGAGRLGIGLTSPTSPIHTHTGNATNYRAFTNTACGGSTGSDGFSIGIDSNANVNIWNFENTYTNFGTNGGERMRITSDGIVAINTTTPSSGSNLDVNGKTKVNAIGIGTVPLDHQHIHIESANPRVLIRSTGTNAAKLMFGDQSNNDAGVIEYAHSNNMMSFATGTAERMRIDSSGKVGIGNNSPLFTLDVRGGREDSLRLGNTLENGHGSHNAKIVAGNTYYQDLKFQSSDVKFETYNGSSIGERFRVRKDGGVCFNGDSADANALDDYEEGTWTPDLRVASYLNNANSFTYTSRTGFYTKIGRQVHVQAYFVVSDFHTYTGNLYLFGLPFTPASGGQQPVLIQVGDHANFSGTDQMGMFVIIEGGYSRGVLGHQKLGGWSHMTRSEMDGGGGYISGTYYV